MNILHLTTFLQGGAGRMIASLAVEQHRAGHAVTVIASRTGPEGYGNYDTYIEQLARAGVPVHLVDSMFRRDHADNLAVVRLVDRVFPAGEEPDLIHAHAAIPSLVALTFAGSRARPAAIVQTMHGWGVSKTSAQAATDATLLTLVHRVAVPSAHARDLLVSMGVRGSRIAVVPYGIADRACDLYASDRAVLDDMAAARRAGLLVAVSVGTIGVRKNQRLLVEALAVGGRPSVFAVFVGDGDESDLRDAIERAGLADRCRIRGYSSAARYIAAAADVFVLPSRSEGQPVSVIEAFADRTLVAVSDIPELVELVDDGRTGVVFSADSPESLWNALARVQALSLAERAAILDRAQARYLSSFTTAAMHDRYAGLYREVIDTLLENRAGGLARRSA